MIIENLLSAKGACACPAYRQAGAGRDLPLAEKLKNKNCKLPYNYLNFFFISQ